MLCSVINVSMHSQVGPGLGLIVWKVALFNREVCQNLGCGAGSTVCSISVSGEVSPCSFLGPEYNAGCLRDQPFDEIWRRSQVLNSIRTTPEGTDTFNGGCRLRALAFNGSINAPDPWVSESYLATGASQEGGHAHHPMQVVEIDSMITGDER